MGEKVAVLCIATNGYAEVFSDCIESHQAYCKKHGYEYYLVAGSPPFGIGASESSWMKIPLILRFINSGRFGWVVFLDADCHVRETCPRIQAVEVPSKSAFFCHDESGRINAGMIIVRCNNESKRLFKVIARSAWVPSRFVPRECQNLYENGHVIWKCRNDECVHILNPRWNRTHNVEVEDEYISHGIGRYFDKPRLKPDRSLKKPVFGSIVRPCIKPIVNELLVRFYWKELKVQ